MTTTQEQTEPFEVRYRRERGERFHAVFAWIDSHDAWQRVLCVNESSVQVHTLDDLIALCPGMTARFEFGDTHRHYVVKLDGFSVSACVELEGARRKGEMVLESIAEEPAGV